jgi:hypothetical protein
MEVFYNKIELLKQVEKLTGFRIAPITLWTWEKKGLFSPSGFMMVGEQKRPVYDIHKLGILVERANHAVNNKEARIKL